MSVEMESRVIKVSRGTPPHRRLNIEHQTTRGPGNRRPGTRSLQNSTIESTLNDSEIRESMTPDIARCRINRNIAPEIRVADIATSTHTKDIVEDTSSRDIATTIRRQMVT